MEEPPARGLLCNGPVSWYGEGLEETCPSTLMGYKESNNRPSES